MSNQNQKKLSLVSLLKTHSYKELLSEYHKSNVEKAKKNVAFIEGVLLTDDDTVSTEVNPCACDVYEHLHNFRVLGRRSAELGGGEQVKAILFSTSAPFDIDSYGDASNTQMSITNDGECTVTSMLYLLNGWAENPMRFFGEVLGTALETTLVDGCVETEVADLNQQGFKVYTPRGAKMEEEVYPYCNYFQFINEAVVGLCGTSPGVSARTKPVLDEAIDNGEIPPLPFSAEFELLNEHMFHKEWETIWDTHWQRQLDHQVLALAELNGLLANVVERSKA